MAEEQKLQRKIQNYLKKKKCWVVKTITCNIDGVPDIIACHEGRFLAIEVKSARGVVDPLQDYQIKKIRDAHGESIVARSLEDVMKLFED